MQSLATDCQKYLTEVPCHTWRLSSRRSCVGGQPCHWVSSLDTAYSFVILRVLNHPGNARRTEMHDIYEGFQIPANSTVIPNVWCAMRPVQYVVSDNNWTRAISQECGSQYPPSEFVPERFLGTNPPLDPGTYVFGFGRRHVYSRSLIFIVPFYWRIGMAGYVLRSNLLRIHCSSSLQPFYPVVLSHQPKIRLVKCSLYPCRLLLAFSGKNCPQSSS